VLGDGAIDRGPQSKVDRKPPRFRRRRAKTEKQRSNETHRSTTDPEARLYRKGPGMEARLCFMGHTLMENRAASLPIPA
jgi:hypothetical protein